MLALILVCQTKCFDGGRLQPRLETVWWFMDESTLRAFDCTRQCTVFSSSPLSHNLTRARHTGLDGVKQHQDLQHLTPLLLPHKTVLKQSFFNIYIYFLFLYVVRDKTKQNGGFWEMNRLRIFFFFFVICVQLWEQWCTVQRVERGPHLGCSAQSSQSLWVF